MKVEREPFTTKKGTQCYKYFVNANIHGKDVHIELGPPDKDADISGYQVLDVVFGAAMEADLIITPFEMKMEDGKIIRGNRYSVRSIDEDGNVYECPVKPLKTSGKNLLAMLNLI